MNFKKLLSGMASRGSVPSVAQAEPPPATVRADVFVVKQTGELLAPPKRVDFVRYPEDEYFRCPDVVFKVAEDTVIPACGIRVKLIKPGEVIDGHVIRFDNSEEIVYGGCTLTVLTLRFRV